MKKKDALVLAGGAWQVPLINFLNLKNYNVTVVDPYSDSPGVLLASNHIKADVKDYTSILKKMQDINYLPSIVLTDQSDVAVQTQAIISSAHNLKCNDPNVVERFTNKFWMRSFAKKSGIPIPDFEKVRNIDDVIAFMNKHSGKAIMLKPADSQSSRGIFKIEPENSTSLNVLFDESFSQTRLDFIIAEVFFEGIELTLEGFCQSGKHHTLTTSQKKHFRVGIASDLIYPSNISPNILHKIIAANDLFVELSGLNIAITHAEYLLNPITEEFCMVEIACRGGGTHISSDIVPWVTGIDLYSSLLNAYIGDNTSIIIEIPQQKSAVLHFFEFPNGTVRSISGIDEINSMNSVFKLHLEFKIGDIIYSAADDRSRQGFVIIFSENPTELQKELGIVISLLEVKIENLQ
jgi:hypothetical protein